MNNQEVKILTQTTSILSPFHPDAYRISKEICEFTNFNSEKITEIVKKLKSGMPWEYIRGWAEFKGLKLKVSSDTLIPRIETEQLVDLVVESVTQKVKQIVDVGTGSGAIAISIKKVLPALEVIGLDISSKALEIAKENAQSLNLDIHFRESNLLNDFEITKPTIVVANLPYIPHSDYLTLDSSVKDYEPSTALDGGENGLDYINELIEQCRANENVISIFLEIDPIQDSLLKEKYPQIAINSVKDYQGLVRFLKLDL